MGVQHTKEERRELKSWLRYGDVRAIAKAAAVSPKTVAEYFNGTNSNLLIREALMAMVEKRKREIAEMKEAIKS